MLKNIISALIVTNFALLTTSYSQEANDVTHFNSVDDYMANIDLDAIEIRVEKLSDTLYVLDGIRGFGNILASIGKDGVLIVDDDAEANIPKIKATINELGGGEVDFTINTHWHFDHSNGNKAIGPGGGWIVSQSNSRKMMTSDQTIFIPYALEMGQPAYEEDALPVLTFDKTMQFHFNGEQIDLLHFGPAHTTGDAAVYFRKHNIVHMGDVFNNSGFPFIDAGNGGSIDGFIHFCSEVLKTINKDTVIFPGHGTKASYDEFESYIDMLATIRDKIKKLIDDGASLDQIQQANVTEGWDLGGSQGFINRSYTSMIK